VNKAHKYTAFVKKVLIKWDVTVVMSHRCSRIGWLSVSLSSACGRLRGQQIQEAIAAFAMAEAAGLG